MTRPYVPFTLRHGQPPEPIPECTPTYTLDRQVAGAREEMGEERWAQLQREWADPNFNADWESQ